METKQYDKRPLTVGAFRFDADQARARYDAEFRNGIGGMQIGTTVLQFRRGSCRWYVWNPGRGKAGDWQEVTHGDYIIVAPTGCRYPVQADQFVRNYAEVVHRDGHAPETASEYA